MEVNGVQESSRFLVVHESKGLKLEERSNWYGISVLGIQEGRFLEKGLNTGKQA